MCSVNEMRKELQRCGWEEYREGLWTWVWNPEDQTKSWPDPSPETTEQTLIKAYKHCRFIVDTCCIPVNPDTKRTYKCVWEALYDDPEEQDRMREWAKKEMEEG